MAPFKPRGMQRYHDYKAEFQEERNNSKSGPKAPSWTCCQTPQWISAEPKPLFRAAWPLLTHRATPWSFTRKEMLIQLELRRGSPWAAGAISIAHTFLRQEEHEVLSALNASFPETRREITCLYWRPQELAAGPGWNKKQNWVLDPCTLYSTVTSP